MENINKLVDTRCKALEESKHTFFDIFTVMFSNPNYILGEWNDGYKIYTKTYGEAKKQILDLAYSLNQKYMGLHDQYIGIAMESSMEWIISFWAILASGNKPYLVNLRHPKGLVNHLLKSLEIEYVLGISDLGYDAKLISFQSLDLEAPVEYIPTFADEMALSTSATTLKEKIIFYSGKEISYQILTCRKVLKENKQVKKHYKERLKQLVFLPLYHIFGFIATYMWFSYFGRTMVFLKDYSSETILRTIRKHEVTHVFAVPLFWSTIEREIWKGVKAKGQEKKFAKGMNTTLKLQKLFGSKGLEMSKKLMHEVTDELFGKSVLFCISGGSYIKNDTLKLINSLGYPLYNGYGMSEIGITSVELGNTKDRLKNSVGKPLSSVSYRIEDGELYVKGTSISHKMKINGEYIINEDEYKTNDLARIDSDGRCYILGRKDDLYIGPNGENVSPDQIEQFFTLEKATHFSILPIEGKLSLVIEISKFLSKAVIERIYKEAMETNDSLDSSMRVHQIYFTKNPIQAETAIKVSRQYLDQKIKNNEVVLVKYEELSEEKEDTSVNPLILKGVVEAICYVLNKEEISPQANFFFDLEGSSLDYFSLISMLNQKFGIQITFGNDKNYHTALELAMEIERLISL